MAILPRRSVHHLQALCMICMFSACPCHNMQCQPRTSGIPLRLQQASWAVCGFAGKMPKRQLTSWMAGVMTASFCVWSGHSLVSSDKLATTVEITASIRYKWMYLD